MTDLQTTTVADLETRATALAAEGQAKLAEARRIRCAIASLKGEGRGRGAPRIVTDEQVLEAIGNGVARVKDIAGLFGVTRQTIARCLRALREAGKVVRNGETNSCRYALPEVKP